MKTAGSDSDNKPKPLWLLAELTYACPLQCPYCSNPVDFAKHKEELTTEEWLQVLRQARAMGATQLGFSGVGDAQLQGAQMKAQHRIGVGV